MISYGPSDTPGVKLIGAYYATNKTIRSRFSTGHRKRHSRREMNQGNCESRGHTTMHCRFAVTAILVFLSQTAGAVYDRTFFVESIKYARSQTAPTIRPEFEVASIRPTNPQWPQINVGVQVDGAQVRFTLFNLITYVGYAYEIPPYQIEGPEFMGSAVFDISAKMPEGANPTQVRA